MTNNPLSRRRRLSPPSRFSFLLFTFAFLCLSPPAPAQPAEAPPPADDPEKKKDPLVFKVRLGWDRSDIRAWAGRWNPLFVTVENRGDKDFDGAIAVAKERQNGDLPDTSYSHPIKVSAGARKRLAVPILIEDDDKRLDIRLHAGPYGSRQAYINPVAYRPSEELVLVCADEPAGTFNALAPWEDKSEDDQSRPWTEPLQRTSHLVRPDELPESWTSYGAANAVVIETGNLSGLVPDQIKALRDYVDAGGTLVVAAGRHAAALRDGPLAELLPARIGGTAVADSLDLRGPLGGRNYDGRFAVAHLEAPTGAILAGPRAAPTAVEGLRGAGRVVLLAFSLSEYSRVLRAKADREFVGGLIAPAPQALSSNAIPRDIADPIGSVFVNSASSPDPSPSPLWDNPALRNEIDQTLRGGLIVPFPPVLRIATLIVVYFLLCVPVNYLVWRWTHRLELAWTTAIVLSGGFGAAYYYLGTLTAGTDLVCDTVTFVETRPGSSVGRYRSFHCLYSPSHLVDDLKLDGSKTGFTRQEPLLSRLRSTHSEGGIRGLDYYVRWDGPTCVFSDFEVYPRAARTFEAEGTCDLGGGIVWEGDRVVNRTPWPLSYLEIRGTANRRGAVTTRLDPGGSAPLEELAGSWRAEAAAGARLQAWAGFTTQHIAHPGGASLHCIAYAELPHLTPQVAGRSVKARQVLVLIAPLGPS